MQMNTDPEWLKKMAAAENGQFVSVGGLVFELEGERALSRALSHWNRALTEDEIEALKGPRQRYADLPCSLRSGLVFYMDACPGCGREVNLHPHGRCFSCRAR